MEEDLKESDYDTIAALVRLLDKDENANETAPPPQMEEKKKQKKNVSLEEFKKALKVMVTPLLLLSVCQFL